MKREPDFENLKKVLARKVPDRPVLFELMIDMPYIERLAGSPLPVGADELTVLKKCVEGWAAAGYDYTPTYASAFHFDTGLHITERSRSLNDSSVITDWESFEAYQWPDPESFSTEKLDRIKEYLPDGMKLMIWMPCGILENLINFTGYDNLCMMLYDEPELVEEIANHIGKRMYRYMELALQHDTVGIICANDDWGFNTQTFLSPRDLRKYIFPWHKRISELAHRYCKPTILHSCGYFKDIIDDIVDDMGFSARHSYQDNIMPVEEAYETYNNRIAILGGIDIDFLYHETPENITTRCRKMLERTAERGGYALGSGNSIPYSLPFENYMAMLRAVKEFS